MPSLGYQWVKEATYNQVVDGRRGSVQVKNKLEKLKIGETGGAGGKKNDA